MAARRALKSGTKAGDGDSLVFATKAKASGATGTDTLLWTWYVRVPASAGDFAKVRAAAALHDPNAATKFTAPVLSTARSIKIDGDRPSQGNIAAPTVTLGGATSVNGFSAGNATRDVLGIGDTVKVAYNLGNQADNVILSRLYNLALSFYSKIFPVDIPNSGTATQNIILAEGAVGDFADPNVASSELAFYLKDTAGNLSSVNEYDQVATGVTATITFVVDTKRPALDAQVISGDTILPVSGDTISDGTLHASIPDDGVGPDNLRTGTRADAVIEWKLPEALDSLVIFFDGSTTDATVRLKNRTGTGNLPNLADQALGGNLDRILDFTSLGDFSTTDSLVVADADGANGRTFKTTSSTRPYSITTSGADSLITGLYDISFTATDLAGNISASALKRTGVYVDVDDITLVRLFPTGASNLDTLERETSKVVFRLSEAADSLAISYQGIAGPDAGKTRTRKLSGSSLAITDKEQVPIAVDSLKSGTDYILTILARDLAGNFTQTAPDTFRYDTLYQVPVIAKFSITASKKGYGGPILAGDVDTLVITAQTSKSTTAVTYKKEAILKIKGKSSINGVTKVSGTGADDKGNGRIVLNADDWVTGARTVIIKDTVTVDTLSISVVDSTVASSIYAGSLDSVVVVNPNTYDHIWVSAPDTVTEGAAFWVDVKLVDKYGNTRVSDNRYVQVIANKIGVDVPGAGGVYIAKGVGGFWATSQSYTGNALTFRVRDVVEKTGFSATSGDNFVHGITPDSVVVLAAGASSSGGDELNPPGEPFAQDYMGADGLGDQGGFILLNFAPSADHETLTAYRIWREIVVDHDLDATGALVETELTSKYIPWAKVDAVPGIDGAMHVVVATLDGVATNWALSAERGRETTAGKQSFIASAQSIMQSRQTAKVKTPVFATLTPEALAFIQKGIAPRMKDTLPVVVQSAKVYTKEPVRAIDNIAPEAVTALRAIDTPNDAGGSLTLNWVKSESDRMLSRMIPGAVGPVVSDAIAGVKGYNISRKSGRGDYTLVGKTGPGETSFVDNTVFNGERYTYKVSAYDEDNTAPASVERTAMAIRNRVFDRTGAMVLGLFGVDNKVGFDDFFVLADRFGLTAADEGFDSAFDLRPDNRIDFDDFFVFADNFGKAIEGSAKAVPVLAGLNTDARLDLNAGSTLPRIGEELTVAVDLANFVEVKGYGFSVNYDPSVLEFVRVAGENSLLGEGKLAQPQVANKADGAVAIAAYGQTATQGNLGVSLVFRTKAEIENSYIDITEAQLQDGSYGLNVATLGQPAQVQTRPEIYKLADNYPNPFNPETTLKYQLPEAADVKLEVYNVVGQVVRILVAEHQHAGRYVAQWDATNDNGQPLSSGIYFYHIQAGDFQKTKKMLLLK